MRWRDGVIDGFDLPVLGDEDDDDDVDTYNADDADDADDDDEGDDDSGPRLLMTTLGTSAEETI